MNAIILAAGMGRRLKSLTLDQTKCMIIVEGERLIDRMVKCLINLKVYNIIIVTGHKSESLKEYLTANYEDNNFVFIHNELYESTNNIYSLFLASDYLIEDDTLVLESDLIFDPAILTGLINDPNPNLSVVAKVEPWMNGTMLELDKELNVRRFINMDDLDLSKGHIYYKTVNIHKFSKEFSKLRYIPFLKAYIQAFGKNQFYEQVLSVLSILDRTGLKGYLLNKEKWYEIDDQQDLIVAETLFCKEHSLAKYQANYGGYWRFPGLLDFCYLANPYFPTLEFKLEFKKIFDELLCSYPSGRQVNEQLAANLFNVNCDFICVANGASELIKEIGSYWPKGSIGIIYPTFEEYPQSFSKNRLIPYFCARENDFNINLTEMLKHFSNTDISVLILVNPNIPTGTLINDEETRELLTWAKVRNIAVVIDESFMDFNKQSAKISLFSNEKLIEFQNLIIIKSVSKSFGIPGLRLGVLASSNEELIKKIRYNLPIWNINSFAEYFMQIFPRYEAAYKNSCKKLSDERRKMFKKLETISFLKTFPSHGNFFLCEIRFGLTSKELSQKLLSDYNILIKDCSSKLGLESSQYIRLAIKNKYENEELLKILLKVDLDLRTIAENLGTAVL